MSGEEATKGVLSSYGAAELLNHLRWDTHPEKILLLAAWHEARGGTAPWKSADMDAVFLNAKERPPANFPRDIKTAIKSQYDTFASATDVFRNQNRLEQGW